MRKRAIYTAAATAIVMVLSCSGPADDFTGRGFDSLSDGQYEEALRSFDRAVSVRPNSLRAWTGRGIALTGLSRYEEALKAFDRATSIAEKEGPHVQASSASLWSSKGMIYFKLKNFGAAIIAFDKAVELNPGLAGAWYQRAVICALTGQKEQSVKYLSRAISLEPNLKRKTRAEKAFKPLWERSDFNLLFE